MNLNKNKNSIELGFTNDGLHFVKPNNFD